MGGTDEWFVEAEDLGLGIAPLERSREETRTRTPSSPGRSSTASRAPSAMLPC